MLYIYAYYKGHALAFFSLFILWVSEKTPSRRLGAYILPDPETLRLICVAAVVIVWPAHVFQPGFRIPLNPIKS